MVVVVAIKLNMERHENKNKSKSIKFKKNKKSFVQEMENVMRQVIKSRNEKTCCEVTEKDFEIGYKVGKGKFGHVFIAREKRSKFIVALKVLYKQDLERENMLHQVAREISIHTRLHHPNIINLLTYYGDFSKIVLVLEFAGQGELYKCLKKQPQGRFREGRVARYVYQVADAINYCHEMSVIHRDIKPENLLLDIKGNIKLSDFGWSVQNCKEGRRRTLCGTLDYIAPEIVEDRPYDEKLDNWSIGVLCFELLAGYPPFQGTVEDETLYRIVSVEVQFPSIISSGAKTLISSLLRYEPEERLSLVGVMNHFWISQYIKNK